MARGSHDYAENSTETDSDAAQAIKSSGGSIFGKTNTPLTTGDHQTNNDVYLRLLEIARTICDVADAKFVAPS